MILLVTHFTVHLARGVEVRPYLTYPRRSHTEVVESEHISHPSPPLFLIERELFQQSSIRLLHRSHPPLRRLSHARDGRAQRGQHRSRAYLGALQIAVFKRRRYFSEQVPKTPETRNQTALRGPPDSNRLCIVCSGTACLFLHHSKTQGSYV